MIKFLVPIDRELQSALPALAEAAGVVFSQDEVQRIFADRDTRRRDKNRYVLYQRTGMSLYGKVEESQFDEIWLTVGAPDEIEAACERVLIGLPALAVASETPSRPWFRFGLKSLFFVVLLLTVPLVWTGVQLKWIRDRHEMLSTIPQHSTTGSSIWTFQASAPTSIGIFGEEGVYMITLPADSKYGVNDVSELFPEARVHKPRFSGDTNYFFY